MTMSSRSAAFGLAAAIAIAAPPAWAQMHSGHFGGGMGGGHMGGGHMGGGGHFAGTRHFGGPTRGPTNGLSSGRFSGRSWNSGTWRGSGFGDHDWHGRHWWWSGGCCGFWGLGWGWWGDPFWGADFFPSYDFAPSVETLDDLPDYGPPAPPGYDCDGWRWDAAQQRYLPAKVSCD
jgi:hypothetical protein